MRYFNTSLLFLFLITLFFTFENCYWISTVHGLVMIMCTKRNSQVLSWGVTRVHLADVLCEHSVRDSRGRRAVADDGDVKGGASVRASTGAPSVLHWQWAPTDTHRQGWCGRGHGVTTPGPQQYQATQVCRRTRVTLAAAAVLSVALALAAVRVALAAAVRIPLVADMRQPHRRRQFHNNIILTRRASSPMLSLNVSKEYSAKTCCVVKRKSLPIHVRQMFLPWHRS